jgi:hypothetical protein
VKLPVIFSNIRVLSRVVNVNDEINERWGNNTLFRSHTIVSAVAGGGYTWARHVKKLGDENSELNSDVETSLKK